MQNISLLFWCTKLIDQVALFPCLGKCQLITNLQLTRTLAENYSFNRLGKGREHIFWIGGLGHCNTSKACKVVLDIALELVRSSLLAREMKSTFHRDAHKMALPLTLDKGHVALVLAGSKHLSPTKWSIMLLHIWEGHLHFCLVWGYDSQADAQLSEENRSSLWCSGKRDGSGHSALTKGSPVIMLASC